MTESLFGPIWSSWDIEQRVISTYKLWVNEYLAEIERKREYRKGTIPRPPSEQSIHGGVDLQSWTQDDSPEIIVVVEPTGIPEKDASVGYTQAYEIQVGAVRVGSGSELAERPEDEARAVASYYGAASMLLVQQSALEGLAIDLVMVGSPRVTFPNPDLKQVAQSVATFHTWVTVIEFNAGPNSATPKESPEYNGREEAWKAEPTVAKTTITDKAEPI